MLWEHDDNNYSSGGGARTTMTGRRTTTDKDGVIVGETPSFPDKDDNKDNNDMDKDMDVEGCSAVVLPSASAALHFRRERERMRRF